ncbi:hypothetical protein WME90_33655 [Sorangium sp. So ce375]|uniref:hypothetical protein n=1 Tax=Sorangium sp. So ce375 TaxID=3133306 RepID=UPI003F5C59BC
MKSVVVIVCAVPLVILFYAACSVAPETEAEDNAGVEEPPTDTTEEEPVAVGAQELDWWVHCKNLDSVECMIKCAEAGVPCRPSYKHPYKDNAGNGDLTGCIKKPKEVCVYHYSSNGDGCFLVRNTGRAYCVYVGGRR